ncbi:MAG: hypothetical protein ACRDRJ_22950 [Streptosporangiaceae bacterium]
MSGRGAARVVASVTARRRNRGGPVNVATFCLLAGGEITWQVTQVGGLPWQGGPGVVRSLTEEERRLFCARRHRGRGRGYLADLASWYGWTVVA